MPTVKVPRRTPCTAATALLFAYGASDWFAPQIADFSRSLGIDGSTAYTSAFVIMALAMALTRVAVTAFRAIRATGACPGPSARQSPGRAPATPIFTTTLTEGHSPARKHGLPR